MLLQMLFNHDKNETAEETLNNAILSSIGLKQCGAHTLAQKNSSENSETGP